MWSGYRWPCERYNVGKVGDPSLNQPLDDPGWRNEHALCSQFRHLLVSMGMSADRASIGNRPMPGHSIALGWIEILQQTHHMANAQIELAGQQRVPDHAAVRHTRQQAN